MNKPDPCTKTISVLYVDDEPGLLEIGKLFLENTGHFQVDTLEDAKEALHLLMRKRYDAIVSDYQMPIIDGITFLIILRKRNNNTPFIIFTGKGREDVVIEALNSGADYYLQKGGKPAAQFAELAHKIRRSVCMKMNETLLFRTKQNLAAILETMTDGMVVTDEKGTILAVNRTTIRIVDLFDESDLLGTNVFDYILDEDKEWLRENFIRTLNWEENTMKPFRAVMNDGRKIWMEAVSVRMRYEGQDAVLVVFRDITGRIEALEKLRQSDERYVSIVESQTETICRFLPDTELTFMNSSFIEAFEMYIGGEVKRFCDVVPTSEHDGLKKFLQSFTPDDRVKDYRHLLPLKEGTMVSIEWNILGMFDVDGGVAEYQAVGRMKPEN